MRPRTTLKHFALVALASTLLACGSEPVDESPPPQRTRQQRPDWLRDEPTPPAPAPPTHPDLAESPDQPAMQVLRSLPRVSLEGYGIRIVLYPPFMVGRAPVGPNGRPDQLIHAHPDRGRMNNLMVLPSLPSGEPAEIHRFQSGDLAGFQVGPEGTQVVLGLDMEGLEGVADLEVGPAEPGWTIVSGGERTPWPVGTTLRSTEDAPGFEFATPQTR